MIKSLGIIIGGIFIGAVGIEIIHKKFPGSLDKFCDKTSKITSGAKEACGKAKEAFKAGYENATRPRQTA